MAASDDTEPAPPSFWDEIPRSGVTTFYLSQPPGGLRDGTLAQLPPGDRHGFEAVVREIRARVDGTT